MSEQAARWPEKYDRLVVLVNPASTQAPKARKAITTLQQRYGEGRIEEIETVPELEITRNTILSTLRERDILGIAGGDGTVNVAVQTLVSPTTPTHIARTPLLTFGTGNANDLAHVLHRDARSLTHVLEEGKAVPVHPLHCEIIQPGGIPENRYAACYASFGAVAHAAAYINDKEHRGNLFRRLPGVRHLIDAMAIGRALRHASLFTIEEDGREREIFDRIISNGPRMAKFGRFPVRLTEQEMFVATVSDNSIASIARNARDLARGTLPGDFVRDESVDFRVASVQRATPDDPGYIYAQFDGEAATYPPGTHVSVRHALQPFYAFQLPPVVASEEDLQSISTLD